ncbi:hypothetical protein [Streptomyces tubercidicus]|nr:hypothetical protein OG690_30060 [Streptomyces tubercidicus]
MEWINPRYADLVAPVRTAQAAIGSDEGPPPIRVFLVPDAADDEG